MSAICLLWDSRFVCSGTRLLVALFSVSRGLALVNCRTIIGCFLRGPPLSGGDAALSTVVSADIGITRSHLRDCEAGRAPRAIVAVHRGVVCVQVRHSELIPWTGLQLGRRIESLTAGVTIGRSILLGSFAFFLFFTRINSLKSAITWWIFNMMNHSFKFGFFPELELLICLIFWICITTNQICRANAFRWVGMILTLKRRW